MSDTGQMKIALVTGGGSGIGAAAATALAGVGFSLVVSGRRPEPLAETAAKIQSEGGTALAIPADVADPQSVAALFAEIKSRFGRLDLLFNNAGMGGPRKTIDEMPIEEWRRVIDTNLNGSFYCAREAFALMRHQTPRGGRIINNGSLSATVPRPQTSPYVASKHAISGLTRSIALEGREFDIACGQLDIGNAATDMTRAQAAGTLQADGSMRAEPRMDLADVGHAIVTMATMPPSANVLFMTVMATKMPYVGRG